ncbi:MAG TPA: GIY-YIG nuclease family protein [Gemmatimonadaceae bacterium]
MRYRAYYVYILASHSRTLYIGVTRDLRRRIYHHRSGIIPGFSSKYRTSRLVYFEETGSAYAAISREKELKAWRREKKLRLIESVNAGWVDLAADW